MSNAHKLCERFEAGDFGGLVIDYSDCTLGHQPQEYRQVANIFAEGMPQGLPFAFVYRRDQLAHILVITRTLNMSGLKARGFDDTADAEHWVFTQIGADRSAAGEPRMLGPMDEDQ